VPIIKGADPVFETVTVCAWLVVPTERLPKEIVEGEVEMPGNVPCPLTVAIVETSPLVSLIISEPEIFPVAVGEKLKLIEHDAPASKVVEEHWSDSLKLFDTVIGLRISDVVPVFVMASVCAWLMVPTAWAPKISNEGATESPRLMP
jgi:hypothetical protein